VTGFVRIQVFKSTNRYCQDCKAGGRWIVLNHDGTYIHFWQWVDAQRYADWLVKGEAKSVQS
jgi:hypothetical protein